MSAVFKARLAAAGLSSRHHEVLILIARGLTNAQIGTTLGVTEDTIKLHVRHILEALRAKDRAHAVAMGYRHNLFPNDPNDHGSDPEQLLAKEVADAAKVLLWDHLVDTVTADRARVDRVLNAARRIA
jgi:DNA-binding CsgD family transcriptional regulator